MKFEKTQIHALRAELGARVETKQSITRRRRAIKAVRFSARGAERHREMLALWSEAGGHAERVRNAQLALAYARGLPYWRQERRVRPGNEPSPSGIVGALGCLGDDVREAHRAAIAAWLAAQPDPEAVAAHDAHEAACREAARARRLAACERHRGERAA